MLIKSGLLIKNLAKDVELDATQKAFLEEAAVQTPKIISRY